MYGRFPYIYHQLFEDIQNRREWSSWLLSYCPNFLAPATKHHWWLPRPWNTKICKYNNRPVDLLMGYNLILLNCSLPTCFGVSRRFPDKTNLLWGSKLQRSLAASCQGRGGLISLEFWCPFCWWFRYPAKKKTVEVGSLSMFIPLFIRCYTYIPGG